jgi:hypothetical protein
LAPTVGIAATGFGIRAGSFNSSIGDISKFFLYRQDQQIRRLPTTEAVRSIQQNLSSISAIVYIVKIFKASSSRIVEFVQIDGSQDKSRKSIYSRQAMRRVTIKLGYASRKRKR